MKDKYQISPYLLFFLLYVNIVDLGILNYQRTILDPAGYSSWISVCIIGISIHLVVWMMYSIMSSSQEAKDLVGIHRSCFGRYAGKLFDIALVVYFFIGALISFRGYLVVIQAWLFPVMPVWGVSLVLIVLIYYTVAGGIRTINGLSFWGALASIACIVPVTFAVSEYAHPRNLLPILSHSLADILMSSKSMVLQYMGVEALLMLYPFFQSPAKSQRWAHLAVVTATLLYAALIIATYMFYSENQLRLLVWPTLHAYMIVQLPLFQRLEYMVISILCVTVAANIALQLWTACRATKQSLRIRQRLSLAVFLILFLVAEQWVIDYDAVQELSDVYGTVGLYVIYVYIPVLFIITQVKKRYRKHRVGTADAQ